MEYTLINLRGSGAYNNDKNGFGGAILMDLSKAFNTINHDLLIAKLYEYGFDTSAIKLIRYFI